MFLKHKINEHFKNNLIFYFFLETEKKTGRLRETNGTENSCSSEARETTDETSEPEDNQTTTRRLVRGQSLPGAPSRGRS